MTIGIAASGPWAGAGVLAGLRGVEAIGRGAIGGFVSLAALTQDGDLVRAETQRGGTGGLFAGEPPEPLLRAPAAALISSGPDRPQPLSQFVAAAPGVGIVTGHRFPQTCVADGQPLNGLILRAMAEGLDPDAAIWRVIKRYPGYDAGFIALAADGAIGLGNMPSVLRRADQGAARLSLADPMRRVATLHNAIHPHRALADMVNEIVADEMLRRETTVRLITVSAGVELTQGAAPEIDVDESFNATGIRHPEAHDLRGLTSFGLGDRVRVILRGRDIGWLGHEPYMTLDHGRITGLDGKVSIAVPVLSHLPGDGAKPGPEG